jgi:hypothetical protein
VALLSPTTRLRGGLSCYRDLCRSSRLCGSGRGRRAGWAVCDHWPSRRYALLAKPF